MHSNHILGLHENIAVLYSERFWEAGGGSSQFMFMMVNFVKDSYSTVVFSCPVVSEVLVSPLMVA